MCKSIFLQSRFESICRPSLYLSLLFYNLLVHFVYCRIRKMFQNYFCQGFLLDTSHFIEKGGGDALKYSQSWPNYDGKVTKKYIQSFTWPELVITYILMRITSDRIVVKTYQNKNRFKNYTIAALHENQRVYKKIVNKSLPSCPLYPTSTSINCKDNRNTDNRETEVIATALIESQRLPNAIHLALV